MTERVTKYQAHSDTSREAARAIEDVAETIRGRVYRYIKYCRDYGATDEEIQVALHLNPSTQRPRRIELMDRGLVNGRDNQTRKTRSGRAATVWFITVDNPAQLRLV